MIAVAESPGRTPALQRSAESLGLGGVCKDCKDFVRLIVELLPTILLFPYKPNNKYPVPHPSSFSIDIDNRY
jgi:hypothetical protein